MLGSEDEQRRIPAIEDLMFPVKAWVWVLSEERRKGCSNVGSRKIKLGMWGARRETGRLVGRAPAVLRPCERESSWLSH